MRRWVWLVLAMTLAAGACAESGPAETIDCGAAVEWSAMVADIVSVGPLEVGSFGDRHADVVVVDDTGTSRTLAVWGRPDRLEIGARYRFNLASTSEAFFEFVGDTTCYEPFQPSVALESTVSVETTPPGPKIPPTQTPAPTGAAQASTPASAVSLNESFRAFAVGRATTPAALGSIIVADDPGTYAALVASLDDLPDDLASLDFSEVIVVAFIVPDGMCEHVPEIVGFEQTRPDVYTPVFDETRQGGCWLALIPRALLIEIDRVALTPGLTLRLPASTTYDYPEAHAVIDPSNDGS